jgi:hypothetical protein
MFKTGRIAGLPTGFKKTGGANRFLLLVDGIRLAFRPFLVASLHQLQNDFVAILVAAGFEIICKDPIAFVPTAIPSRRLCLFFPFPFRILQVFFMLWYRWLQDESPTIWCKPFEVFDLSFADLSLSRAHTVGAEIMEDPDGRGIVLRFPRFKRRRPDRSIEEATTTEEVAHLFYKQTRSRTSSDVYNPRMPCFGCVSSRASMSNFNDTVYNLQL